VTTNPVHRKEFFACSELLDEEFFEDREDNGKEGSECEMRIRPAFGTPVPPNLCNPIKTQKKNTFWF
jgi:hypothetical protein